LAGGFDCLYQNVTRGRIRIMNLKTIHIFMAACAIEPFALPSVIMSGGTGRPAYGEWFATRLSDDEEIDLGF
jgi:hypothetical protein